MKKLDATVELNSSFSTKSTSKQKLSTDIRCVYLHVAWLSVCLCVQTALGNEGTDLRAQRIEAIKTCKHGPDEACPHGRTWHVDNWAPSASDKNDGTQKAPFKTINKAAQLALPGDTVLVAEGVYREHVSPGHSGYDVAHMITYSARDRHRVIIKGSDVWKPKWRQARRDGVEEPLWQAELDPALFTNDFPVKGFHPFHLSDQLLHGPKSFYEPNRPLDSKRFPPPVRGMIFVDGRRLHQARSLVDFATGSDVFFVAADGKSMYARFIQEDPAAHFFEITTREQVFAPKSTGVGFIRVKGFVMEHGATGPAWIQYGMVSPSSDRGGGWHWIIEDNVIRWSNACGLDIGMGYWGPGRSTTRSSINEPIGPKPTWAHWIKGNAITDNGQAGMWSIGGSSGAIIEYNRIERNGWKNNIHHVEAAGLKMHGCDRVVIRGNLVRDNDAWGLWLDIAGGNNRLTQNLLISNMLAGVHIEGMWGHTLVDNNISAFTRTHGFYQMNLGDGFYGHQSSHVTFAHNLSFANTGYGLRLLQWGKQGIRTFPDGKSRVSHNRMLNNIAYANGRGAICLPMDQPYCKDNKSDHNFIWGASGLPLFELGRGILPPSQMMATVESAMKKAGAGPDQIPMLTAWKNGRMGPNVGDMRHYGPLVSLSVWQAAEKRDLHSVVGPLPTLWLSRAGQIEINLNIPENPVGWAPRYGLKIPDKSPEVVGAKPENYRRLDEVHCPPIPEITLDYFGRPRPKGASPTVGPFQNLDELGQGKKTSVFLNLWPLVRARQPSAESLRLNRPAPKLDEQEKASAANY